MKTVSILLALINSLAAGLVVAASLPAIEILHPASSMGHAVRVACNLVVIAAVILTWTAACRHTDPGLLFVAGLFLAALGTASAVWTVHRVPSDAGGKDHMLLHAGSLMAQGTTTLWGPLTRAGAAPGL